MKLQRIAWTLFFLPIASGLLGYAIVRMVDARAASAWREQQILIAVEESKFVVKSVREGWWNFASSTSDQTSGEGVLADVTAADKASRSLTKDDLGEVRIVNDVLISEKERQTLRNASVQWLEEPNGYVRVRSVREVYRPPEPSLWVVLNKRLSPREGLAGGWQQVVVLGCTILGGLVALWRFRKSKHVWDIIRALQSLRSRTTQPMSRTEFLAQIPDGAVSDEISRELMNLLDSYHQNYYSLHTGKGQAETVLAAMPVGILAFTSELKLWFANRAGIDLLDLQSRMKAKSPLVELIRNPRILELMSESQRTAQSMDLDVEMPQRSMVLRLRATPLSAASFAADPSGSPAMLLVVSDETRLRQLENYRRDFTANVSHELKTPLAAIKAYAETLLMGALDEEDTRERFVRSIGDQASRLEELILGLLRLTRLQTLPDKIALSPISLADLVRTLIHEQTPIARSKGIEIQILGMDDACRVFADHESLRTIVGNLLSNAIRYSKPQGEVTIESNAEGAWVELSIRDRGIGIPAEDLDRIFERFYTVDKARTKDVGGTGLGLAIVKHLTAAMGGTIRVESQLGVGSVFRLRLKNAEFAPQGSEALARGLSTTPRSIGAGN
ncbi:MAG: sensor histidine kinase [Pirellula sp.]